MFNKILIANRGEIACRVMSTASRMGIKTVAVYSKADTDARHVEMADEAVLLGDAAANESYLCIEKVVDAALKTGAQAIHPGYGFLSENADLALACEAQGLVFIGPPASAIEAMGSKSQAKAIMDAAQVPLVPGYHGAIQDVDVLKQHAISTGFPVLIKASAGGGGKGMRIVDSIEDFEDALISVKRESLNSFGDDHVLLERYVDQPRHVEIQVFFDQHGEGVYLFERDCSVQRRHQKVVEEAPAPAMPESLRQAMGDAAIRAAAAVKYQGAGTVEFLLDRSGEFYFMEMNTRLQVEHPVTEMITGLDLVEWQLRVAAGESLPKQQSELSFMGHAIEARLYAEDPDNQFLPSVGHIEHLKFPYRLSESKAPVEFGLSCGQWARVDSGVRSGDEVSVYYDPMIAKVVAWGKDRSEAIARLDQLMADTQIVGLKTNRDYIRRILNVPAFNLADQSPDNLSTHFVEDYKDDLSAPLESSLDAVLTIAAAYLTHQACLEQKQSLQRANSVYANIPSGWRLNLDKSESMILRLNEALYPLEITSESDVIASYRVARVGKGHQVKFLELATSDLTGSEFSAIKSGDIQIEFNGVKMPCYLYQSASKELHLLFKGNHYCVAQAMPDLGLSDTVTQEHGVLAPMHGNVVSIAVSAGDLVSKGQPLAIVEAMKMEHTLTAPYDGIVASLNCVVGDQVSEGHSLMDIDEQEV